MKVTNKQNMPSAFVNLSNDIRAPKDGSYSATEILKSTREILLTRRHFDEIEVDVADRAWLVFGTAVHKILENADHSGYAEMELEYPITKTKKLTGICDLFNESEFAVEDYKTCAVWKLIYKDFGDWRRQGLTYAWMLRKKGKIVSKLRFHALIKDWSPNALKLAKLKGDWYPEHPIWTWNYEIHEEDMVEIEEFINSRFKELIECESLSDLELPLCSLEERWNPGNKYAIIKKGKSRASKVCDTLEEAESLKGEDDRIEIRKGEDKKCLHYCQCHEFCDHYLNDVEGKDN